MIASIYTANLMGIEGELVKVEVAINNGIPSYNIVGLAGLAIKESGLRIKPAFINMGIEFPKRKITVNLVPAGRRKEGSHFDLPIAMGIIAAEMEMGMEFLNEFGVLGEVSLDGKVNPVRGALPICLKLIEEGKTNIVLPEGNLKEVSLVDGGKFFPVENIGQVAGIFAGRGLMEGRRDLEFEANSEKRIDFSDVCGQDVGKRAFEIGAAGCHGIMMYGGPGVGKTMMARRIGGILPAMSKEEILETTKIYSVAGLLSEDTPVVSERPVRCPHHSTTRKALIGGGYRATVGEISLAHNGVLFLDEFAHFDISAIDGLREPLEEGRITISRLGGRAEFPAKALLVAATNPCKCGNLGNPNKECKCTAGQIASFHNKFSSPILDRIDLHVSLNSVKISELDMYKESQGAYYSSSKMRSRIEAAREIQKDRYINEEISLNSELYGEQLDKYARVNEEGKALLTMAYEKMNLSIRSYEKVKKIARTIADLDSCEEIAAIHISEALQYRQKGCER